MAAILLTNPPRIEQSQHERRTYTVTTTAIGSNPVNVEVNVYDITGRKPGSWLQRTNVSTTVFSGAVTVVGDVITWPELLNLTPNRIYRVETLFDTGGNRYKAVTEVKGLD